MTNEPKRYTIISFRLRPSIIKQSILSIEIYDNRKHKKFWERIYIDDCYAIQEVLNMANDVVEAHKQKFPNQYNTVQDIFEGEFLEYCKRTIKSQEQILLKGKPELFL